MKIKFHFGEIFHVFNKTIANFKVFDKAENTNRFLVALKFYNNKTKTVSLSRAIKENKTILDGDVLQQTKDAYLKFICYCIMPDHYHLLVKVLDENCLSKFISDVENSYVRYFNLKYKRKGPLWQSGFKHVRIRNNEQLLHVSRYIHLNPVTSYLVSYPENWQYSSFRQYSDSFILEGINEISINNPKMYNDFVRNNIDYQRKLKQIKKLLFD